MKRLIPVMLLTSAVAAIAAISLVNSITLVQNIPLSYPAPPPKPTMTVTLRIGENFTKKLTLDIPTEDEPSWKHFTITPDMLNVGQEMKCRIFVERDVKP